MRIAASVAIGFVALIHLYIVVLEMFLWKKPYGRKTFNTTKEFAEQTAALAANQGLYNGFLAAGLIWALVLGIPAARPIATFFLACVAIAGIYGALSVNKRILFIQTVPAAIALALLWMA